MHVEARGPVTTARATPPQSPLVAMRERLSRYAPQIALTPSLIASFVYVFLFCGWTVWLSLSSSTLLPVFDFEGFGHYAALWQNRRWTIAYTNLFLFGSLYVTGSLIIGMVLAVLIDQRVRGEAVWRSILLYPLAVSFVVTGTVWRWIFNPSTGIEAFVHELGWLGFHFDWILDRNKAIYTIVITGIWQSSGFAMVLLLAGLRSVDPDLIKAAQIDGASMARIYRKIVLPSIRPIIIAVMVILLQFAIKTFDLVAALTGGGPGLSTNVPAIYVYDLMFQRGQIAQGAAAAVMILVALALVIAPYAVWQNRRTRRDARGS
jgi:glucose/mannose transport system permease protein